MRSIRTASIVSLVLLAGLSVTACSTPAPEPTRTSEIPRSSSATPAPSATPTPTATTPVATEWTPELLTGVCVDFQAEWAEENSYAATDFTWTTPGTTEQAGGLWYVFLEGTFTPEGGDTVPAEFSCAISGTPGAPVIEESPGE